MPPFAGFSNNTLRFFAQLKRNNSRDWFTRHKDDYDRHVLRPALSFVMEMGTALAKLTPGIVADASPGGSIFRIHRDTRFSKDKTPYKTHLGIIFWQASGKKLESPGFYFELDDRGLRLYYGWYLFPPDVLKAYRQAIGDEEMGTDLVRIVAKLHRLGITVGGQHYKRPPKGFADIADGRAPLLLHNTLYTEENCGKPQELFSSKLVRYCQGRWKPTLPLHRWMARMAGLRTPAKP